MFFILKVLISFFGLSQIQVNHLQLFKVKNDIVTNCARSAILRHGSPVLILPVGQSASKLSRNFLGVERTDLRGTVARTYCTNSHQVGRDEEFRPGEATSAPKLFLGYIVLVRFPSKSERQVSQES